MMTIEEIQVRKECQTFDCKSIQIDPKALAVPIVAMANADGGVLAIGVSDKTRRIEGVDGNEKRLRNNHCGAGNKPARMVVGALIVKHVENLSNDRHAEEKRRVLCERNEIEATFGTSKRVYRANDIRAKLDNTADTWIGACFFAKNVMKFLRGLLCLVFAKTGLEALKKRVLSAIDDLVGVLPSPQVSWGRIN